MDALLEGVDALQRTGSSAEASPVDEGLLQDLIARLPCCGAGSPASPAIATVPTSSAGLVATTVRLGEPCIMLAFDDAVELALRLEMLDTLSMRPNRIRMDFAHVGEVTASALALLASFAREAGRCDPAPALDACDVPPAERSILRAAGLARAFRLDV